MLALCVFLCILLVFAFTFFLSAYRVKVQLSNSRVLFSRVWLPPLLIALACAAAAAVAFGNDPNWIHHAHGLAVILMTRRLLWPLMTLSVMLCVALIALVVTSKRSVWWLIGLLPVVALIGKRLAEKPTLIVLDNPTFVAAGDLQTLPKNDTPVVGLTLDDQALSLPYDVLALAPAVFITEHDKRALVMFNAPGNRAVAYTIARELKPKDLEIVSSPGGVPLIYDTRLGQFIVSETGRTVDGTKPVGFLNALQTEKTTWQAWRLAHPDTKIFNPPNLPTVAIPGTGPAVTLIPATQPVAVQAEPAKDALLNFKNGNQCLLALRDPAGRLHVFDRQVGSDLFPKFSAKTNRKLPEAALIDSDTASAWTIDGRCISGPLKGQKLKELPIEPDLDWPTLKFWEPNVTLAHTDEH